MNFEPEKIALLKETICRGATDQELELFMIYAQRTGLDPFARQIHAVKRWDSKAGKEVMSIQVSIDGLRLIAQRSGEYEGQTKTEWCNDKGEWFEVWLSKEYPFAAKVGVYRRGFKEPLVTIAKWDSYVSRYKDQKTGEFKISPMWAKMPDLMLAKVAEALALRKSFPAETSGIYTNDESIQEDGHVEVQSHPPEQSEKTKAPPLKLAEKPDQPKNTEEKKNLKVEDLANTPEVDWDEEARIALTKKFNEFQKLMSKEGIPMKCILDLLKKNKMADDKAESLMDVPNNHLEKLFSEKWTEALIKKFKSESK